MRDKMFRGKRKDTGDWVYSRSIIEQTTEYGEKEIFIPKGGESSLCTVDENDNLICIANCIFYKVIPETVGQYTGLTDNNGKKIFEGDIIRCIATMCDGREMVGYIIYEDCCFCVNENRTPNLPAMDLCDAFEVIGNIHDNPDLFKERDKE